MNTHKKKRLAASEQDALERLHWRWRHGRLPADELVAVDTSAAATRRRRHAAAGHRAASAPAVQVPCNRGANPTILAAMTPRGLLASMTVEGAANAGGFLTCLDRVLCPALRRGQK